MDSVWLKTALKPRFDTLGGKKNTDVETNVLIIGGGGHRTGKNGGCWQELEDFAHTYCKNAEIVDKWATQDCMTLNGIPYIGQYAKSTPDVFVATGFNKWGMTNAMVAADILCDLVQEKPNP